MRFSPCDETFPKKNKKNNSFNHSGLSVLWIQLIQISQKGAHAEGEEDEIRHLNAEGLVLLPYLGTVLPLPFYKGVCLEDVNVSTIFSMGEWVILDHPNSISYRENIIKWEPWIGETINHGDFP